MRPLHGSRAVLSIVFVYGNFRILIIDHRSRWSTVVRTDDACMHVPFRSSGYGPDLGAAVTLRVPPWSFFLFLQVLK